MATSLPPTVLLRLDHSAAVGQQASPGKHLHEAAAAVADEWCMRKGAFVCFDGRLFADAGDSEVSNSPAVMKEIMVGAWCEEEGKPAWQIFVSYGAE